MIRYLLDTNVVSELRKNKPHGAVVAWVQSLDREQILISAVTIGELQAGVELTRRQDAAKAMEIEHWIAQIETSIHSLPMDSRSFRQWAKLMDGKSAQLMEDAMIAAIALVHSLSIATRNERDFRAFNVDVCNPFKFST